MMTNQDPRYYPYPPVYYRPVPFSGLAISGMILGIVSTMVYWVPLIGFLFSGLAMVFSGGGLYETQSRGKRGTGMAVTGMVLGILVTLAQIGIMILWARATGGA